MTGNVNLWQFLFELMHVRTLGCYRLLEKKKKKVTDRIKRVDHFKFIISLLWNRNHQDSYE